MPLGGAVFVTPPGRGTPPLLFGGGYVLPWLLLFEPAGWAPVICGPAGDW